MTLQEARDIVAGIIAGEEEAGAHGNAYLDPPQVEALRELLAWTGEGVIEHPDGEQETP